LTSHRSTELRGDASENIDDNALVAEKYVPDPALPVIPPVHVENWDVNKPADLPKPVKIENPSFLPS